MSDLKGKTLFITGASRGIGLAIALRAAQGGANIVIAAKTVDPHPRLPGTIHDAARQIEAAGGSALPLVVDVRFEEQIHEAVERTVEAFGGIDILVNNASAISLTGTLETPLKRFDLMMAVNVRGSFACAQACIPWLKQAKNPHVLVLAPPISLNSKWYGPHVAYSISKFGMSMLTLGLAEELREQGIAVNALWPVTLIATSALDVPGLGPSSEARSPRIMADAAHRILTSDSRGVTGNFFLDEELLREAGETDFSRYVSSPDVVPRRDLFVD